MCSSRLERTHDTLWSEITECCTLTKFGHPWENPFNDLSCKVLAALRTDFRIGAFYQFEHFFNKFFGGHKSFLWGHWYPCFGLLVTSALGFKAGVVPHLCTMDSPDSPLVRQLPTSWWPARQLVVYMHVPEVGCKSSIGTSRTVTRRAIHSFTAAGLLWAFLIFVFTIYVCLRNPKDSMCSGIWDSEDKNCVDYAHLISKIWMVEWRSRITLFLGWAQNGIEGFLCRLRPTSCMSYAQWTNGNRSNIENIKEWRISLWWLVPHVRNPQHMNAPSTRE